MSGRIGSTLKTIEVLCGVCGALLGGCAPALVPGAPGLHGATTAITVQNGHCADITVYATIGPARYRLGEVGMFGSRTFSLPRAVNLPADVALYVIARVDGQEFTSPWFLAKRGDRFTLNVENSTQYSSLLRR